MYPLLLLPSFRRSFIIELLDQPPPSPGIDGLDVDIEAYNGPGHKALSTVNGANGPQQRRVFGGRGSLFQFRELAMRERKAGDGAEVDFDLVIKTPENLKWKLHSRSISRKVGIVVSVFKLGR